MSNKPISFGDLRDGLSERERLEHLLSNKLYYCSMVDFIHTLRLIYVELASSDAKTLMQNKKKVYFDFSEYSGAVMCNAVVAMCAHINKADATEEGGLVETYRMTINSIDPFNEMGSFLSLSGGRPKFVLNVVFSIGNKNVAYGFFKDTEEENTVASVDGPEKLLRHHIILHGEGVEINPDASFVLEGLYSHSKRVHIKTIEVEAYPATASNGDGVVENVVNVADDCTVTVDRIGVNCVDRVVFDEMIYLIENDPLSVLLHILFEGSV